MLEHTLRTYQSPTRLVQRLGAIKELGQEASLLGVRRPLLVTDPGVKAAGLLEIALESLRASDCEPVVFDRVKANPPVELVDAGAAEYKKAGCDGLVAIGGGSSMDTAKGIGVVAAHDGSILDYEWGHNPISSRIPPMIAVPTTAGTGSEVTLWAVITDTKRKIKFNVGGTPNIASWVALIDPELSVKLPAPVTAGTGMDALAHAVECYTMVYHQPFTDAVALMAMEYVARYLRVAFSQGENLQARYYMSAAAMLAGLAYGTDSAGARGCLARSWSTTTPASQNVLPGWRRPSASTRATSPCGAQPRWRSSTCTSSPRMSRSPAWRSSASARTRSRCSRTRPSPTRRRSATRAT